MRPRPDERRIGDGSMRAMYTKVRCGAQPGADLAGSIGSDSHCDSHRCCRRKFVPGLPWRPGRAAHRAQERIDVLVTQRRRCVVKHVCTVVPMHGPAARFGCRGQGLAIHDGIGDVRRARILDALLGSRRKCGTHANGDASDRDGHRCGQCREVFTRAVRGCLAHAFDEEHGVGQRNLPRPRAVDVAAKRPRSFVVIRVRRQSASEIDAPAIEEVAIGSDGDEDGRVAVLGDADGSRRCSRSLRHVRPFGRGAGDRSYPRICNIPLLTRSVFLGTNAFPNR